MRWKLNLRALSALGFVLAGALTMWACSTPVKVDAEVTAGPFGGRLTIGANGEPVVETRGPVGTCIRLTYVGANGANIHSEVVEVGGASQVPAGAVRVDYDLVACPDPAPSAAPSTGGIAWSPIRALPFYSWHDVYSFPLSPGGGSLNGAVCRARVWCGANENPSEILRPILQAGPGSAVPPHVQVLFFADASPSLFGATLRVAMRQPILDMSLEWNGIKGFADLATGVNAVPQSLPNGWYSVESYFADADIGQNVGDWNRATLGFVTLAQPMPEHYSMAYQVLGY